LLLLPLQPVDVKAAFHQSTAELKEKKIAFLGKNTFFSSTLKEEDHTLHDHFFSYRTPQRHLLEISIYLEK
jgi:hypothetical protein